MIRRSRDLCFILAGLLASASVGCRPSDASGAAPEFNLRTPAGDRVSLSRSKGRYVILNFWATWCDSCLEELPALRALAAGAQTRGYDLLAVSVDDQPQDVVPAFAKAHAINYPILYVDQSTMNAYGVRMLPTTFLIDPAGRILRRYVGPLDARAVQNDILSQLNRRTL